MSDSLNQNIKTNQSNQGATKVKVAPIPPDRYTSVNSKTENGKSGNGVIPESAGARIPITFRSQERNPAGQSPLDAMPSAIGASVPDVMADEFPVEPVGETVEQYVQRMRPKTLWMQLRFLYTLLFALWLFGRLIFWQVYVARFFPDWVHSRNIPRWRKYARQFRKFALRMGGVQIKAGQFASTRADVLPEAVIAELAGLQDKVPTIAFKKIRAVLEAEIENLDEIFESIDENPVAAASLGQVHRAKFKDETSVVVKVQRPNVRNIVYTDMAALFIIGHVAMRFRFVNRRVDAGLIIEEFGRVLLEEISYEKEADNARRFKEMFANNDGVYIPTIYEDHSTDKVLVMEDVTSIKIDDYARLAAAGIDRLDVAKRLMDTYMQQIFEDRFFHADPHPGNLFIYPLPVEDESQYVGKGGRPYYLIFIDFGMTGTLTREIVQGLINTLTAVITRDAQKLVDSYEQLGFLLPSADKRRIVSATEIVFNEVWGMNMTDMQSIDFDVISNIGKEFNDLLYDMPFAIPQDFVYLGRTVSILTGMSTKLDPNYNPWVEIQRWVQHLVTTDEDNNIFDEFGKIVEEAIQEIMTDGAQGFFRVAERVVKQFQRASRTEQMLEQIINGQVTLETKLSIQERRQLERLEIQGKRTARMFLVGSLLICATLLYINGEINLAIGAGIAAIVVFMSSWFIRQ